MENFRLNFKKWRDEHSIEVSFVAEKIGVSEGTVYAWLSKRPIPILKQKLIEDLMENYPPKEEPLCTFELEFTEDQAKRLVERAAKIGISPGEYCSKMIDSLDIMKNLSAGL